MNFIDRYFTSGEKLYEKALNYLYGLDGKDVDVHEAYQLLQAASERGSKSATTALTDMFQPGSDQFTKEFADKYEKIRLHKIGEQFAEPAACYYANVPILYREEDDSQIIKAIQMIRHSAAHDFPPALMELGYLFYNGVIGEKNEEKGKQLYRKAASLGHEPSIRLLYQLGEREYALSSAKNFADSGDDELTFLYGELLYMEDRYEEAFIFVSKVAKNGNGAALRLLGLMYEYGNGCEQDLYTAVSCYQASADAGFVPGCICLANILCSGPEEFRDETGAFELFMRAAKDGEPEEWNYVGHCYVNGIGVEKSEENAMAAYMKATTGSNPGPAYYYIYKLLSNIDSPKCDIVESLKWLERSAEAGFNKGCFELGTLYKRGIYHVQDFDKAFHWFKAAADKGDTDAMFEIAQMFIYGVVVEKDERKGFEMLRLLSDHNAEALRLLGSCYSQGIGTQRNFPRAFRCYTVAAERGSLNAVYDLAICYRFGEGVPQNIAKAVELYEIAIEHGHAEAMSNCGILYELGMGVEQNLARAIELYTQAARLGNCQGQFLLGQLYSQGRGVEQDYVKAVELFRRAAAQDEPDALFHLGLCYFEGLGVEQDSFRAIKYLYASADRDWQPAIDFIQQNHIPRPE